MCGRPPVGKGFFDDNATLVGTAMCPACLRDADPWPLAIMCSANQVAVRSTQSLCGTGYHGLSWSPDRPARCIVPSCGDRYPLRRLSKSFGKGIFRSDSTSPHPHPATHIVRSRGWPGGGVGRCRFHVIGKCSRFFARGSGPDGPRGRAGRPAGRLAAVSDSKKTGIALAGKPERRSQWVPITEAWYRQTYWTISAALPLDSGRENDARPTGAFDPTRTSSVLLLLSRTRPFERQRL